MSMQFPRCRKVAHTYHWDCPKGARGGDKIVSGVRSSVCAIVSAAHEVRVHIVVEQEGRVVHTSRDGEPEARWLVSGQLDMAAHCSQYAAEYTSAYVCIFHGVSNEPFHSI